MIVRGEVAEEHSLDVMKAILMRDYHQQNSEIDKMPIEDVVFFISLHLSIAQYKKQLFEQQMAGKK